MISTLNKRIVAVLSGVLLFAVSFWFIAQTANVYEFAITGALFEILWLPVILAGFAVPIIAVIYWYRDKFSIKSAFLYLAIISILLHIYVITTPVKLKSHSNSVALYYYRKVKILCECNPEIPSLYQIYL